MVFRLTPNIFVASCLHNNCKNSCELSWGSAVRTTQQALCSAVRTGFKQITIPSNCILTQTAADNLQYSSSARFKEVHVLCPVQLYARPLNEAVPYLSQTSCHEYYM